MTLKTAVEIGVQSFDTLLVFKVDRLSRNVRQLSQMVEELTKLGIVLKSVPESNPLTNDSLFF